MEEQEQEALRRKEDKDYGFPFVEVKPLAVAESTKPESVQHIEATVDEDIAEVVPTVPGSLSNPIHFEKKPNKKRNQTPLLITLVFMLAVILAAMAYFLYYSPAEEPKKEIAVTQEPEVSLETAPTIEEEVTPDTVVVEQPITAEVTLETPKEATDTPVIQAAPRVVGKTGQLYPVESKGEKATYHLIVASLPNERIAKEEAQAYLDRGRDVWMIFPSGDTKNYRLSVGTFGSFKSASEALPQAKIDFGESTWILKY